jgi:signal transduction histidine kinase/CheY-like chemotaxis protein
LGWARIAGPAPHGQALQQISVPDPQIEGEVRNRTTALLYRNVALAQAVAFLLASLLVASANAPGNAAALWWGAMAAIAGIRLAIAWKYAHAEEASRAAPRWREVAIANAAIAGLAWAVGAAIFMTGAPVDQQIYFAFVHAGVVAGAVPILAAVPLAFRVFSVPGILVVMAETGLQGHSPLLRIVAMMSLLFLLAMMRSSKLFAQVVGDSIRTSIERLRLVHELEASRDAAQQASLAKSRFLATMSHELRTPMNGVLGMAQLLLTPGLSAGERDECVRTIHSSGSVLMAQLNDILDLSRIEAGRFQVTHADFDPERVCREVVAIFHAQAQASGVLLHARWQGPPGATYRSDPVRIRQMLMNLVNNAVKFTPAGQIEVLARIVPAAGDGRELEFAVRDSGIGIAAADQTRLFQPFSQVDSSDTRAYSGTGLGLSIVRNIAELLGGSVGVESEPGQGSRFWFRVPALPPQPAAVSDADDAGGAAGAACPPALAASSLEGRFVAHVLVAEDVAVNRKVVGGMLRKLGCTQHWVEDGEGAVQEITGRAADYDLVLMDCQMPRMDGYEAAARIRAWERENGRSRLAIVALSAAAYREDIERCLSVGMDDFLAKPLSLEALSTVLEKWLPEPAVEGASAPGG